MKKVKEFLQSLLNRFKALFQRSKVEVATPTTPEPEKLTIAPSKLFAGLPREVVLSEWKGRLAQELLMYMGRGFMGLEERAARDAGIVFRDPPVYEAMDRSGFDLEDQRVVVNPVSADQPYTFTVKITKSKQKFAVFGAPGAFFSKAAFTQQGVTTVQTAMSLGTEFDTSLPPGTYQVIISVNEIGRAHV